MEKFSDRIDSIETKVHNLRLGFQLAIANFSNQIFCRMSNMRNALQPNLRRSALDGVERAEETVDVLRRMISLYRKQALLCCLQVLFSLRHKEFQDLGRDL